MKKNDLIKNSIIVTVSLVVIFGAAYFAILMVYPSLLSPQKAAPITNTTDNFDYTKTNIDDSTYNQITKLSDYGKPPLTNVGRPDIFANY